MRDKLILLLVLLLGIVIIAFVLKFNSQTKAPIQSLPETSNNISNQTQIDEKGEVVVEAMPVKLSTNENTSFDLKFTTHSVELNYDIKSTAFLTDDKENEYRPTSWTGGSGGHHIQGILTFPKISKEAKSVKLTIPGIGDIDRTFEWSLE